MPEPASPADGAGDAGDKTTERDDDVDALSGGLALPTEPGAGGFDLSSLLDSAQQLMSAQQQAADREVTGSAGGGQVEVTVTGGGEFTRVRINPSVVDPDDVALLEDLVLAALRDAMARVNDAQAAALGGLDLGGLDLGGLGNLGGLGGLLGDR